jgi:hypothetical protein
MPSAKSDRVAKSLLLGRPFVIHGQAEPVDEALAQRGPDGPHRQGTRARDGAPRIARVAAGKKVRLVDQIVTQAKCHRLNPSHPPAGIEHVRRALSADGPGQGHREPKPVMEAQAVRNWR